MTEKNLRAVVLVKQIADSFKRIPNRDNFTMISCAENLNPYIDKEKVIPLVDYAKKLYENKLQGIIIETDGIYAFDYNGNLSRLGVHLFEIFKENCHD